MQMIFSDIDGTLINDQHVMTEKTRVVLKQKINDGSLFIPVSARMPAAIHAVCYQLDATYPVIAYNGALILDKDGQTIHS